MKEFCVAITVKDSADFPRINDYIKKLIMLEKSKLFDPDQTIAISVDLSHNKKVFGNEMFVIRSNSTSSICRICATLHAKMPVYIDDHE